MFRRYSAIILLPVTVILILAFAWQSASGDDYNRYRRSRSNRQIHRGGMIASELRHGREVDDWIERGESVVTESPKFKDGIRLAARASRHESDYALASAIYLFEIPSEARSIRVEVRYKGRADRDDFGGESVGRIWIKSAQESYGRGRYGRKEGRLEADERPLQGDTFILRKGKDHEEIVISAVDHISDGIMELHAIAEGRQIMDLKNIEVKAYTRAPDVKVITGQHRDHHAQRYRNPSVYWHFYAGPVHLFGDRNYVRYVYPRRHVVEVRRAGSRYFRRVRRPFFRMRWSSRPRFRRYRFRGRKPVRLKRWAPFYAEIRW